jgi:hypothetical protein
MGNIVKQNALSISNDIIEHLKPQETPSKEELYREEIT